MKNLVAIVGTPNVGKSTLFNKLCGKRVAIVHDQPGVTRDRLYQKSEWQGNKFNIIDTGGIEMEDRPFQEQIKIQANVAIEEANIIVFVVDGRRGLSNHDDYIATLLRRTEKRIIVVANKLEGNKDPDASVWSLGFDVFPISAVHGDGIGDMLDELCSHMDFSEEEVILGTKRTQLFFIVRKVINLELQFGQFRRSIIKVINKIIFINNTYRINWRNASREFIEHEAFFARNIK